MIDYEKYVQEILASAKRSTPDVSAELVSNQLDLDIEEVNRLLNHVKAQKMTTCVTRARP